MARSLNQVTLMGNLTRDPDLRETPTGQKVTSFGLALNRSYKDSNGEWLEATDFVDIVCWGPLAERVDQYLSKGRKCLVQGRLQSRNWEQDGQKRSKVEVLASDVTFLDSRGSSEESSSVSNLEPTVVPIEETKKTKKITKKNEMTVDDIGDEPIDLDDIPF
jgi:single-strand DNA-binding protein